MNFSSVVNKSKKKKFSWFLFRLLSLFSVVRGYNILVISLAQYLASIFILSTSSAKSTILDLKLFCLILASAICIASGYIINNFYDSEKDLINRPKKSKIDRLVSQQKKLIIYFILNFTAVIITSYVSFKAVLFFSFYIFCIWLYSHKIKRLLIWGNITATTLALLPFFAVFIYFKNFEASIFSHAIFLALIILIRELVKDLENLQGDFSLGYKTLPVVYGEKITKYCIFSIIILCLGAAYILVSNFHLAKMDYYFGFCTIMLVTLCFLLGLAKTKKHYLQLHFFLKLIIVTGVCCIPLINSSILKNGF